MSSEGLVPPASPTTAVVAGSPRQAACLAVLLMMAGCADRDAYIVAQRVAPDAGGVAQVRLAPCGSEYCQTLWVGKTPDTTTQLAALQPAAERAEEIVWSRDGKRVGFLINGYQLRLYDAQSHAPAGQINLVPADTTPTTRIARGVTFSDIGAALTFDDCPRDKSGCRPGLVGIR
jgi:hypothetical protein